MLSDPRTPRSSDIQNVYGVGYVQETDQSIEFYDKNSCVLLGCFYIAVIVMLGYCIVFGAYIVKTADVDSSPFHAIDVDYVQHLLRRLAFLFVVNAFLWYIMFSHRYRTPLEWLRQLFRRA